MIKVLARNSKTPMLIRVDRADLMLHLPALHRASVFGRRRMTYKSIMVAVDLRPHSEQCITLAASLADRFGARLIGAAAEVEFVPLSGSARCRRPSDRHGTEAGRR